MSDRPISGTRTALHYFAKLSRSRLSEEEFEQEVISGQLGDDPLSHLAEVAEQVYQVC